MKTMFRWMCGICFFLMMFFGCGDIENTRVWIGLITSIAGLGLFGLLGGVYGVDYDE